MACDEATISGALLSTAAANPLKASGDMGSVERHPLRDQIEYDKYVNAKCAVSSSNLGMRKRKLIPGGLD